jgi:hypothetical protein
LDAVLTHIFATAVRPYLTAFLGSANAVTVDTKVRASSKGFTKRVCWIKRRRIVDSDLFLAPNNAADPNAIANFALGATVLGVYRNDV